MKKTIIALIILTLSVTMLTSLTTSAYAVTLSYPRPGEIAKGAGGATWNAWDPKENAVPYFMSLADNYGGSYESIGVSSGNKGWDIILFKFGNPNGGTVMVDSYLHGNEFYGYQVLKSVITWLVTSNDPEAQRILQNNYILVVPVANYRWGRTNYNVPSWMTTNDPTNDGDGCGVNLNRNFGPNWPSSLSSSNTDSYSGISADSEPESQALINAWNMYYPRIYWNLHQGSSPNTMCTAKSEQAIEDANAVRATLSSIQNQIGVSGGWSFSVSNGYSDGFSKDGAAYRGSTGFLTEVMSGWDATASKKADLETGNTFKQVKAMFMAMCQAVENPSSGSSSYSSGTDQSSSNSQTSPSPGSGSQSPSSSSRSSTIPGLQIGVNYLSNGNRYAESDSLLEQDFAFFKQNGISKISVRVMWAAVESSRGQYRSDVIANYKRVLTMAEKYNLEVNIDFWSHFHSTSTYWRPSYVTSNRDIYLDNNLKQAWFDMVTYVVNQLKEYNAIGSWAVMNEPFYDYNSDRAPMEQFIGECSDLIRSLDNRPITCRFTVDYNPWNGKFDYNVLDSLDIISITEYMYPDWSSSYHGATWNTIRQAVEWCNKANKEFWIIEFGTDDGNSEDKKIYYRDSLEMFQELGIKTMYAWAWQSRSPENEPYNIAEGIADGSPAFLELANVAVSQASSSGSDQSSSDSNIGTSSGSDSNQPSNNSQPDTSNDSGSNPSSNDPQTNSNSSYSRYRSRWSYYHNRR